MNADLIPGDTVPPDAPQFRVEIAYRRGGRFAATDAPDFAAALDRLRLAAAAYPLTASGDARSEYAIRLVTPRRLTDAEMHAVGETCAVASVTTVAA